jgi:hypothetical protein
MPDTNSTRPADKPMNINQPLTGEIEYMRLRGKTIRFIDPVVEPTNDKFPHPEFSPSTRTSQPQEHGAIRASQ